MATPDWRGKRERLWIIGEGTPSFSFDAVVSESHTSTLEVTENPVETGVTVADHAFMMPMQLDIEAAVGDVWLHRRDDVPQGETWPGTDDADVFASSSGRAANAFAMLQDLQRAAEPFMVQTGLKLYYNMVVATLSAEQDAHSASILIFKASLKEVIIVSTRTITYPPKQAGKASRQGSKVVTAGVKKATPVVEPPERAQSTAYTLLGKQVAAALGH